MHCLRQIRSVLLRSINRKQDVYTVTINIQRRSINKVITKSLHTSKSLRNEENVPKALRSTKQKSERDTSRSILDMKQVRSSASLTAA